MNTQASMHTQQAAHRVLVIALVATGFACAAPLTRTAAAQDADISEETVEYFRLNCTSCHTIGGGRLTGPDLKDVAERQSIEWLTTFIVDPKRVIDSGDADAQALFKEANGLYMPTLPGMTRQRAAALLELIAYESTKEESRFKGLQISDRPLTQHDIDRGQRLFEGTEAIASGAPSCLGCHTIDGTGGFGGGRLGPDLTDAFSRLEGRKALASWLAAPPGLTMQPVFKDRPIEGEEVLALVAYLKSRAEAGPPATKQGPLEFLIAGIAGVMGALVLFDLIWRRRFRAVRRPLVKGTTR